jgi:hypothetical protein
VERVFRRRITQRSFSYPIKLDTDDYDELQRLGDDCSGIARPFFITRDSSIVDDDGLYARLTKDIAEQLNADEEWYDSNPFTLSVMELSRSLPL